MKWRIPLSDVHLGAEEATALQRVLQSGWLTLGPEVRSFETEWAQFLEVADAVAVSSGTAALHLASLALGVGPGSEVIVPTLSFVATANAVVLAGGRPIFVDVRSEDDLTMDPEEVEAAITSRTVGVVVMHYGGYPCDMDALKRICDQHGLFLMEDAAHAPGAKWGERFLGSIGGAGCFSFFGNKNLTTGEGGMVVAPAPEILERVRLLRSHGMTSLSWERASGHAWDYEVLGVGFNYRLTELAAALGRVQLRKLEINNRRRVELLKRYRTDLSAIPEVKMPFGEKEGVGHLCVIVVEEEGARDGLRRHLAERGIQTSLHYPPIHLFKFYQETFGTRRGDHPKAEDLHRRLITLPLYPTLREEQVEEIVESIAHYFR